MEKRNKDLEVFSIEFYQVLTIRKVSADNAWCANNISNIRDKSKFIVYSKN